LTLSSGALAQDEPEFSFGGVVQSDIRFRTHEVAVGDWYSRRSLPAGVARNQNLFGARLSASTGDVSAKLDADFVLYGYAADVLVVEDLTRREKVDPFHVDVHSLYFQVKDLFVDGLDLRLGQQLVMWGVGDQFNPTNNLNADDLEDPLRFGDQVGNLMAKVDYWIDEDWSLSGVLVPIFKPALLPPSSRLAAARIDRLPMLDERIRHRIESENALASGLGNSPIIVGDVRTVLPEATLKNMQFAFRIAGDIAGQDIALSYYRGRSDFPIPLSNHIRQDATPQCNPEDASQCIAGRILQDVELTFPKMHVYGLNMAGEIGAVKKLSDAIKAIGYRIEAALIVPGDHASPEKSTMRITTDALELAGASFPAGEYDYPGGRAPTVIDDTPFAKWTIGLDYTFSEHVYANVQWVHGLVDEFGAGVPGQKGWGISEGDTVRASGVTSEDADSVVCALGKDGTQCAYELLAPRLADYAVAGLDLRFANNKGLLRLFGILALNGIDESFYNAETGSRERKHHGPFSDKGHSVVIYPQLGYNFGNGLELEGGALVQLGKEHTKFGDPAAGGSMIWTRGRFSF
jgi:hypothetical protein